MFCLRFPTTSNDAYSKCGKEQNREIYDFEQDSCCFLLNWRCIYAMRQFSRRQKGCKKSQQTTKIIFKGN